MRVRAHQDTAQASRCNKCGTGVEIPLAQQSWVARGRREAKSPGTPLGAPCGRPQPPQRYQYSRRGWGTAQELTAQKKPSPALARPGLFRLQTAETKLRWSRRPRERQELPERLLQSRAPRRRRNRSQRQREQQLHSRKERRLRNHKERQLHSHRERDRSSSAREHSTGRARSKERARSSRAPARSNQPSCTYGPSGGRTGPDGRRTWSRSRSARERVRSKRACSTYAFQTDRPGPLGLRHTWRNRRPQPKRRSSKQQYDSSLFLPQKWYLGNWQGQPPKWLFPEPAAAETADGAYVCESQLFTD